MRYLAGLTAGILLLVGYPGIAAAGNVDTALDLANLLRSSRTVIALNKSLINDSSRGAKGLTGRRVIDEALKIFRKRTGRDAPLNDNATVRGRLLRAQSAAIVEVVDEHQTTINKAGVAFKGFVPAVFARLVNERFKQKIGKYAEIKVTAPLELVRNRKARPDAWERAALAEKLASAGWPKGKLYSERADNRGRKAFRVLVPEYYGKGCLSCHGSPKGEIDITGYPKEGGEEGGLAGAISISLFRP